MSLKILKQKVGLILIISIVTLLSCESDDGDRRYDPGANDIPNSGTILPLNETFEVGKPSTVQEKVYMHYLPWFSEGEQGNHWADGTVNQPLIGYYSSDSWATHMYHILLSAAVGIDGAVINVRTDYDQLSFEKFVESIERIDAIYPEFEYDISVSYDDQDATSASAIAEFTDLKDNIIPNTNHYLHKDGEPVIFIWNYDGYLTSQDYRDVANLVFTENTPILLKNELDLGAIPGQFVMNSIYPWVQGWADDGSAWGEGYMNWFYNTQIDFKLNNKVEFVTGAVWPGFDDRNASWGQGRWIDRRNGETYNDTWALINDTHPGEIDWVILETWNDFNEGSEIEPVKGSGNYQYIELTANHISTYKGEPTLVDSEKWMFGAPIRIYEAAKLIENGDRDYNTYYPVLEESIGHYLKTNGQKAYELAEEIISGS
ncbi:hypothetical protein BW723_17595 [Polaribacter reichenbachii]|uniref:Uncharacterized protein n=1 Tax=Polaribacter reichenbachii TaxID=996801 RepID=A0A1B8U4X7_9FLAO|nr:hypothetical protein [Polaribacter reichenbachii]APZ47999.1 hypothetical protein BW723_17595 [Polaribacter reichenbachii]AUC18633.1 hypothetical protein BTO17_08005 [Polaribacter reichenbachii]OBY66928.1 hypothetical protein LPB301_04900 [Polaribacter reichenbachii]